MKILFAVDTSFGLISEPRSTAETVRAMARRTMNRYET